MASAKKTKRPGSVTLSRTRVVGPRKPAASLSAKAGRTLIRKHHTLQKMKSQALAKNDSHTVEKLQAEIEASGGLERYQLASVLGQSAQRGGDSSKVLMGWINEIRGKTKLASRLRVLEVGCLSPDNAIAKSPLFDLTRIDLNSRAPCIEKQDFMERPIPDAHDQESKFDLISLSLVLNYVPEPSLRGEMLRRTLRFLRRANQLDADEPLAKFFPSVFIVLPAPCVTNSRYLNEDHLNHIMQSLGYTQVRSKLSSKLTYGLWRLENDTGLNRRIHMKKTEVNPGSSRNNFAIVLQ